MPGVAARLFVAGIEVVTGNGGCRNAFRPGAVRASPTARKTLGSLAALERPCAAADLRLWSGDEGGQAIDAAGVSNDRLGLWLRLILRLRAMFAFALAVMFARLLLFALERLSFARRVVALAGGAFAHIRLRLDRDETGLLPEVRELTVVVAVITIDRVVGAGLQLRLVLTELLLGRRDQAEVMLGVLIVVFGGNGVT